jgi:hypothetical protein
MEALREATPTNVGRPHERLSAFDVLKTDASCGSDGKGFHYAMKIACRKVSARVKRIYAGFSRCLARRGHMSDMAVARARVRS